MGPWIKHAKANPRGNKDEIDFLKRLRNHVVTRYRFLVAEDSTSLPAIFLDSLDSATERAQRGWFLYVQQWRGPEIYNQFVEMTAAIGKNTRKSVLLDAFSSFSLLLYSLRDFNKEFAKFAASFPETASRTERRRQKFLTSYEAATREGASLVTEWEDRYATRKS